MLVAVTLEHTNLKAKGHADNSCWQIQENSWHIKWTYFAISLKTLERSGD